MSAFDAYKAYTESGLVSTVISAICPKASPRVKATFPVLIRKIHEDVLGRELLALMDRHSFRPAHIYFLVAALGFKTLVTQVFDRKSKDLDNDSVFAGKEDLIIDFLPTTAPAPKGGDFDEKTKWDLKYDIEFKAL